jgi:signal transduction histidine kinase
MTDAPLVEAQQRGSIRDKIIFPFLILTIAVAMLGVFVVTRLIAASLEERLINQVLEAGRVASDSIIRQENRHLEVLRVMAGTIGVGDAILSEDADNLRDLLEFHATNGNIDTLIVLGAEGQPIMQLDAIRQTNINVIDGYQLTVGGTPLAGLPIVADLLAGTRLEEGDKFAQLVSTPSGTMLYSSAGVYGGEEERLLGVIVVGTRLERIVGQMKAEALADLVIYADSQEPIASSIPDWQEEEQYANLIFDDEAFTNAVEDPTTTPIRTTELFGRTYRVGFGPLIVRGDTLGVLGVMLPNSFVVQTITTSRTTFLLIFTGAGLLVAVLGVVIARRIVKPIRRLVEASQAVAQGDFTVRAQGRTRDEIGVLTSTFNLMTDRLQGYTTALEAENARVRAILNSTRDGLIVRNVAGEVTLINPAAEAMLTLEGTLDSALLMQLRAAEIGTTANQRMTVGERTLSVNAAPVVGEDGQPFGEVMVLRDITLEAIAERTKENFLNQVGHEFRTPLTSLKGYTDILRQAWDRLPGERRKRIVDNIYDQTGALTEMVNDLIDLTELQSSELNLTRRPVGLGGLVADVLDNWRPDFEHAGIDTHMEGQDAIRVQADPERLHRLLDYIIANSVHYSPNGGTLTVTLWQSEQQAHIRIRDEGVGIRPTELPHVFDRFFRGQPTAANGRSVDVRGMGAGLYLAKLIVEAHNGTISIDSVYQQGTVVTITLPLSEDTA